MLAQDLPREATRICPRIFERSNRVLPSARLFFARDGAVTRGSTEAPEMDDLRVSSLTSSSPLLVYECGSQNSSARRARSSSPAGAVPTPGTTPPPVVRGAVVSAFARHRLQGDRASGRSVRIWWLHPARRSRLTTAPELTAGAALQQSTGDRGSMPGLLRSASRLGRGDDFWSAGSMRRPDGARSTGSCASPVARTGSERGTDQGCSLRTTHRNGKAASHAGIACAPFWIGTRRTAGVDLRLPASAYPVRSVRVRQRD